MNNKKDKTCDHYIGIGFLNYFDEQDDNSRLITYKDYLSLQKRFEDVNDLILEKFIYCPKCGCKL